MKKKEQEEKIGDLWAKKDIAWGSQIRSYTIAISAC
jgi:protein subunit release factor B